MMETFVRGVERLSWLFGVVAALMLVAAVAVVCQMVVVRYIFHGSSIWQTEFVVYILIASTFIGSPYVLHTRGHVNVDLLPLFLKPRARFWLALLAESLAFVFCVTIAWLTWEEWVEAWAKGWLSDSVWEVRLWIPYMALPAGMGMLSLQYLAEIISLLMGRCPPFGIEPVD